MKTHCIPLHGITEHLREFHADSLSKKQRGELVKYANSLKGRLMNPKDIRTPAREGGPVDGLYKIKGWECLECDKLLSPIFPAYPSGITKFNMGATWSDL
jgi:hypothetical protein